MDPATIVMLGQAALVLAIAGFGLGFLYLYLSKKPEK